MKQPQLYEIKDRVEEAMLAFLWKAWANLGVSHSGDVEPIETVLDPEVLILFTAVWGRGDARLFDEVLDWMRLHASLLQTSRIRTLCKKYECSGERIAQAMFEFVAGTEGGPTWKPGKPAEFEEHEPLFWSSEFFGKKKDPIFERHGFLRAPVELRRNSANFSPERTSARLLRLRAFMGVATRADCSLHLTPMPASASELAHNLGYSPQAVSKSLHEMVRSGIIDREPGDGRTILYQGTPVLWDLVGRLAGRPKVWIHCLQALEGLQATMDRLIERKASERIVVSEMGKAYHYFFRRKPDGWRQIKPERQTQFDLDSVIRFIESLSLPLR